MAVTVSAYTTALESARSAIASSDWDGFYNAAAQAATISYALPKAGAEGATVDYVRDFTPLFRVVEMAQAASQRSQGSRLINTRLSHGG